MTHDDVCRAFVEGKLAHNRRLASTYSMSGTGEKNVGWTLTMDGHVIGVRLASGLVVIAEWKSRTGSVAKSALRRAAYLAQRYAPVTISPYALPKGRPAFVSEWEHACAERAKIGMPPFEYKGTGEIPDPKPPIDLMAALKESLADRKPSTNKMPQAYLPGWAGDNAIFRRHAQKRYPCTAQGGEPANRTHGEGCTGHIEIGDAYVEYVGEVAAYSSGARIALPCALLHEYIKPAPVPDLMDALKRSLAQTPQKPATGQMPADPSQDMQNGNPGRETTAGAPEYAGTNDTDDVWTCARGSASACGECEPCRRVARFQRRVRDAAGLK